MNYYLTDLKLTILMWIAKTFKISIKLFKQNKYYYGAYRHKDINTERHILYHDFIYWGKRGGFFIW